MRHQALLIKVGARVRKLREEQGLSRRALSEKSGVSERFLGQLESGRGNISLVRFADVALALGISPAELLAGTAQPDDGREIIAFLGTKAAGKSSVGSRYAARRGLPFVEIDERIEDVAGLSLSQIFDIHDHNYYHKVEREVLGRIIAVGDPIVLATGGSIVTHEDNYAMLREATHTVWLRARAEDHWKRLIDQGDERPIKNRPNAFAVLKATLAEREPHCSAADHIIDTSGKSIDEVVELVELALSATTNSAAD
jgi:XRE family aerobic/anaerobic benzoate catabolism transcriptional regulator